MRNILFAAGLALTANAVPTQAQSAQDMLDERYNRALAAGYKALMLCGAIGNAESFGANRTPESVHEWELTGIQAPLDGIVREMPYEIARADKARLDELTAVLAEKKGMSAADYTKAEVSAEFAAAYDGRLRHVTVEWADDMPPRIARYDPDFGCATMPIGYDPAGLKGVQDVPPRPEELPPADPIAQNALGASGTELLKRAFDQTHGQGSRTTAVLIHRAGEPVLESYLDGFTPNTPQRTWSVAKSIAATFIGAAVQTGEFDVGEPATLNYWRAGRSGEPRRAITIDHALRMASGRYSSEPGNRTPALYFGGATIDETAFDGPLMHEPGTVFRYANYDTLLAMKGIEPYMQHYSTDTLFGAVGMKHTIAETDWRGGRILSSQVWSTARDFAKLGELYLDNGVAPNGERILPENWRDYVSAPSGPQPQGRRAGYGAGFWLFNRSEGIPKDTFFASGRRGQFIVIVPSRDVVIVRRGEDPVGARFDIESFTRDALKALEN
jgi:CubicO group peptidase (beta-lactamase class C family)